MPKATADASDAFRQHAQNPNCTPRSPLIDAVNAATKTRVDAAETVPQTPGEKLT